MLNLGFSETRYRQKPIISDSNRDSKTYNKLIYFKRSSWNSHLGILNIKLYFYKNGTKNKSLKLVVIFLWRPLLIRHFENPKTPYGIKK